MSFSLGDIAQSISVVASFVPGGQGIAAAAGTLGSLAGADDAGKIYYRSPFVEPLIPRPDGWDLVPLALTPVGASSPAVRMGGLQHSAGSALLPELDRPAQLAQWTVRRDIVEVRRELATIAAAHELARAGEDPAWALWIHRGLTDPRKWFERRSLTMRRGVGGVSNVLELVDRVRQVAGATGGVSASRVVGNVAQSAGDPREWVSAAGTRLGDARLELERVRPIYDDAAAREQFRLEVEAAAMAEFEQLILRVLEQARASLASGALAQASSVEEAVAAVRESFVDSLVASSTRSTSTPASVAARQSSGLVVLAIAAGVLLALLVVAK